MEKVKKNKKTKQAGITLIALVITIIIIIILAIVTINMTFGENGLIMQAQLAKDMMSNSITAEKEEMNSLADEYANLTENDGQDNNYPTEIDGVTIPEGFYYVGGTKNEGIIISDKKEDAGKGASHEVAKQLQGNQFVWVPVEDGNLFKRYDGYYCGKLESDIIYGMFNNCSEPYKKGYKIEKTENKKMKNSVLEHNGFFVGRYETGAIRNEARNEQSEISDRAVVKQGTYVYNYIGWSDSDDMTNEYGGALEKAKKFAIENNYTSVTSTLIYGTQWDAIMNWIDPSYQNENCDTSNSFVANSTGRGNYNEIQNNNSWKGNVTLTGSSADYEVKNIYDLAGNVYEWTMEAVNIKESVVRRIKRGRR